MSTTASINAKGANGTGITEDLVKALHDNLGKTLVAVVEIRSESRGENLKGDEKVSLAIQTVEPAPTPETEDHLRNLARSFHYERKLADGQLQIETGDDLEPKVSDVLAAGAALTPHEFDVDPDEPDTCATCGNDNDHAVHQVLEDPEDEPDNDGADQLEEQEDPAGDPVPA